MKFMLMMHAPKGDGDWNVSNWRRQDLEAHMAFMQRFNAELVAGGELVGAEGLAGPGQAKIVRATPSGTPMVTDGPFAETKEFLAGYWIIACDHPQRAYELAARASAAPGPDGAPLNMPIEVREVMCAPAVEV
jgi:hypothetical protein